VEKLIYSRYWAKEKGVQPTPGPTNMILESHGPTTPLEDLVKGMKRGLLVSRFWYIRMVDPRTLLLTGLTRDGIWLVEEGRIQYPVRNLRFNQSVTEMLAPGNVMGVSRPERLSTSEGEGTGAGLMPALHLKEFHFTSVSEAV
jgi:predicted Zn-dependent protease